MKALLMSLGLFLMVFGFFALAGVSAHWDSDPQALLEALISVIMVLGGLLLAVRMARAGFEEAARAAGSSGRQGVTPPTHPDWVPPRPDTPAV